ncbi:type II toxin-antitoxin system RelE/ParE family toxin [Oceanicola sp. S124]|uniref:type II toxin-antitoxin system RelE/ParE family toxin n=1 Tax=Oceanicola sp. S124 TaxID=1042378 RepID=UPI0002559008|nr:type II toxin-antitoxin system RelE/ParE family toxin [Oceanicola sp. S124]
MQTVIELAAYLGRAKDLLTEAERAEVVNFLAANPEAGDVMQGTGGVRKVRIAMQGRGKSGGARVIYYYHDETMPLFLFAVYAKNEKDNLSKGERNDLKKAVHAITTAAKKGARE